jgi:hypothetical protein
MSIATFIIAAAVVCWILATFGVGGKFNLVAAGLALFGIAYIIGAV